MTREPCLPVGRGVTKIVTKKRYLTPFLSKRRPYIRSAYFNKQKIFFDYFWQHLLEKSFKERVRRLKYFACALDLIKNSKNEPTSFQNPGKKSEILHRFAGLTKDKEIFYVQIKEDKKTNRKYLMSIFPE